MKRTYDNMQADEGSGEHDYDHDDNAGENAEDDNGKVPPYDAKTEKLPNSPVFTPEFVNLKDRISELLKLLADPLKQTAYKDAFIDGLLQEVHDRTRSDFPEEVRIALIGSMKAGKSSVINSILSSGMIARQGDAGGSCTWVVQEFCYLLPTQQKPYAAEVHFFTQDERYAIVKALFADYYRHSPKDDDPTDGPKESDEVVEDHAIMRTTITAFRALFNDHKEFSSLCAASDFLSRGQSEDDEAITETLCEWTDELMAKGLRKDSVLRAEAATTQQLLWELAPYLYTVEERAGEPMVSIWPFVSHIKFGLDCELLKHNITLVDLPGLTDTNKTRVDNALKHQRQCTHYMIVAEIGRADDDRFIRDQLSRGCMTRGSGRTMLVLTHADIIDEGTEVTGNRKDNQLMEKLRTEMKTLDRKKSEMFSRYKSAKGPERWEYLEAKHRLSFELRAKQAEHNELRIVMRSRSVSQKMQKLYEELTQDALPLAVFCVGNHAYKKHQAGYSIEEPPTLSVEGTNIPALRRHLFLAPAEARLHETRHTVVTQIPALINCVNLYASKTHLARKGEVEKIVVSPQKAVSALIQKAYERLNQNSEDQILMPFRAHEYYWTDEARVLCKEWAKMYSTSVHLAFLKKDGIKKGRAKNSQDISWNSDLTSIAAADIRSWFQGFSDFMNSTPRQLTKETNALVNGMINEIRSAWLLGELWSAALI
ncbi:hypothetical protein BAUCODRAFT_122676 [Baudoinia panamericana UAMH 10762]|uniref:Dynamin N-terminal domain-containing protein n=1 Tax=Baudoinia panamericana (strain UAMH 10762) TaxID=717646 RepID=M2NCR3_BAUPA|nr:uncharacterized protein BAUCODRAFT_122676 [Baudoinia panamericana UAMH 10762]EMC96700.1 hypothetical protein BAUCODRAFT_122676 [Baudoinia panamericana UAMH 10762]